MAPSLGIKLAQIKRAAERRHSLPARTQGHPDQQGQAQEFDKIDPGIRDGLVECPRQHPERCAEHDCDDARNAEPIGCGQPARFMQPSGGGEEHAERDQERHLHNHVQGHFAFQCFPNGWQPKDMP